MHWPNSITYKLVPKPKNHTMKNHNQENFAYLNFIRVLNEMLVDSDIHQLNHP